MPKNHFVMIKTTLEEKEKLKLYARTEGYATLTDFCRQRLFQSLSQDMKLNEILELLKKRNETIKKRNEMEARNGNSKR